MPRIFNNDGTFEDVEHINGYLFDGPDIYVEPRTTPLCRVPKMITGNRPADGGNLIIEEKDLDEFLKREPRAKKYIRRIMGSEEFLHNKKRFCLWLVDCPPDEIRKMPLIYERVKKCREARLKGAPDRQRLADTPHLFRETFNPKKSIVIPKVSGDRRRYIPIDFMDDEIIFTDLLFMIPNADLRHFGILTSSVHMAWMRTVCGRLGVSYRYSAKIVYNNFAWKRISIRDYLNLIESAQKILDARKNYPNASLADLYDEITMPKDLRAAHRENDKIVMKIYGYDESMTEQEIAIDLLQTYASLKYYDEHRAEFQDEDDEDGEDCE